MLSVDIKETLAKDEGLNLVSDLINADKNFLYEAIDYKLL